MHWSIEQRNYDSDHRVRAGNRRKWWVSLDEGRMRATIILYNHETEEDDEIEVPFTYEVCPTCSGKGSHVNPSVDCNGLTAEDFAEDPDLLENYMEGNYDVSCYECGGNRVVPVMDEERIDPAILKRIHKVQEDDADFRAIQEAERRMGA